MRVSKEACGGNDDNSRDTQECKVEDTLEATNDMGPLSAFADILSPFEVCVTRAQYRQQ